MTIFGRAHFFLDPQPTEISVCFSHDQGTIFLNVNKFFFDSSAPGGDMQTLIDDNLVPFEKDVVKYVQDVVEGLAYLHHRKIAHLDIKVSRWLNSIQAIGMKHVEHLWLYQTQSSVH